MAFPQLLRRSNFASFDPSITRVYTSTPHSIQRHGDWGLKTPVHRPKGPKYIKVNNLDAGKLLGSDWRSAEAEARFIQIHGTARTPWKHADEGGFKRSMGLSGHESLWGDSLEVDEPAEGAEHLDNVNTMSPRKFEEYLQRVRKYRQQFLGGKIANLTPRARESLKLPEEKTLINLAARQHVAQADTGKFQVALAANEIESPESKRLQSVPHRLYGLTYSRPKAASSDSNPLMYQPARALDPAVNDRNRLARQNENRNEGTNKPWVVNLGGLTAASSNGGGRVNDQNSGSMRGVDFTRAFPAQGEAIFRVAGATIKAPPEVVGPPLAKAEVASAKQRPLDTFKFSITVQPVSEQYVRRTEELGERSYVTADSRVEMNGYGDRLGLAGLPADVGAPRGMRERGGTVRSLKSLQGQERREEKAVHQQQIQEILRKLASAKKT